MVIGSKPSPRSLIILVVLFFVLLLSRVYYVATDDFRMGNITHEIPYNAGWDIPALTSEQKEEIEKILGQTFTYIGKGSQSYVFVSADQKYVIKFFKFKHLKYSWFAKFFPSIPPFAKWQNNEIARKNRKLQHLFEGYHLAWQLNREESGLIYIKLNPSHETKQIALIDKIGLSRTIDLGEVIYVIQKKGQTLRSTLKTLLDEGNVALAKKRIDQISELYFAEYKKGIYDRDHGVMHNTGFVGETPIRLDIGKLAEEPKTHERAFVKSDFEKVSKQIMNWINHHYPQHSKELSEVLDKAIL